MARSRLRLLVILIPILAVPVARAQQAPGSIRGRVVAAENDRPLRHALVAPAPADRRTRPVLTDDDGRFEMTVAHTFTSLAVSKAGYASSAIDVAGRKPASAGELEIRLARGAAVSGRLVDSSGAPAIGVPVVVRRVESGAAKAVTLETRSNDRGEYRIGGLGAGQYTVSAGSFTTRTLGPVETATMLVRMKQGLPVADLLTQTGPTRPVNVRPGDETGDVDFQVESSQSADEATWRLLDEVNQQASGTIHAAVRAATRESINGGAISGMVVDNAGEPLQGVRVRAMPLRREHGRLAADAGLEHFTDDQGRYRVFGLPPGSYLLAATVDASASGSDREHGRGFAQIYYPGAPGTEGAQPVQLEAGGDVTGVDVAVAPSFIARVSGRALDGEGRPLPGTVQLRVSHRSGAIAPPARVSPIEADGGFELTDVAPGDYVVQAIGERTQGREAEFGAEYVVVSDRDPPPLAIRTSPGTTLEGRFVVEGVADPPMRALSIHATTTDLDRGPASGRGPEGLAVYDEGRFSLTGLRGAMRFELREATDNFYLKSVTIGGADVTDAAFDFGLEAQTLPAVEILLSPAGATIAASVTDESGARASSVAVVAFSTNRDAWFAGSRRLKLGRLGSNGSFDINGLPPGEYWVTAIDGLGSGDWQDPETLDRLSSRATRVTVEEGRIQTAALRLTR